VRNELQVEGVELTDLGPETERKVNTNNETKQEETNLFTEQTNKVGGSEKYTPGRSVFLW
jgi:hypothetical protein